MQFKYSGAGEVLVYIPDTSLAPEKPGKYFKTPFRMTPYIDDARYLWKLEIIVHLMSGTGGRPVHVKHGQNRGKQNT